MTMSEKQEIAHHPDDASLMSFAAGSLPDSLAVVIASHCSICQSCAGEVRKMERIGSALFAGLAPSPLIRGTPHKALLGLEADIMGAADAEPALRNCEVPAPIRHLVGTSLDEIRWQRLVPGVWHAPIMPGKPERGDLRLLKVEPGRAMPDHGHGGSELTMILRGAYHDRVGRFTTGDVADLDDSVEHQPIADAETGCICIIASEKQAVFKGFIARLIQPLTRM
jgi:putative transcriptional regulator